MRDSGAYDVSSDGSVIVGQDRIGLGAYRWESGVASSLGPGATWARAVSGDGSVIVGLGYFGNSVEVEAFRWTQAEGVVPLGDLPGGRFRSVAREVSDDGSVVVGVGESESGSEAFRWDAIEGMVGLGLLPGRTVSVAHGIHACGDGTVIVGSSTRSSENPSPALTRPFVWYRESGMLDLQHVLETLHRLDLSGWTLGSATGVSGDGSTIVGAGQNPDGNREAFIATLPDFIPVRVDISPGSEVNPVNLASRGVLAAAILGSDEFDVLEIDGATLSMGREAAPLNHWNGPHVEDIDGDGFLDLVAHFGTSQTGIAFGDEEACVRAETLDGRLVGGCDRIVLLGMCGLGFELTFLLPPLVWLRDRRRRKTH
jgi:uncharacterized membrane protein